MAVSAVGLQTHIWNNHVKSAILLMGFPLLLLIMLWAFFAGLTYTSLPASEAGQWQRAAMAGWSGLEQYGLLAFAAAASWFVISWFMHGRMMQWAAKSYPVTRREYPKIYRGWHRCLKHLCWRDETKAFKINAYSNEQAA